MRRSRVLLLLVYVLHVVSSVVSQSVPASNITALTAKIDTHCHFVPEFYRAILDANNITAGGREVPTWNVSQHLALNAEIGVVTSVISASTPGAKLTENSSIEEGRTLARQLNEYAYNLTLEYPKRFLFFATLTLPDLEGAVAEAEYALDKLDAAGVILLASNYGELLGTPRYAPLYKVLNDRSTTVFVHPSNSPCPEEEAFTANSTGMPSFAVDFLLDTTRAAMNLVYRNVTKDYPNIKFILAHSGGFLPFAATRAAGAMALMANSLDDQALFLEDLKTFHVDLAISATDYALPSTTSFFNNTQITFGSDFPFAPTGGILQNTEALQAYSLRTAARKKINYRNAYGLFKKFLK